MATTATPVVCLRRASPLISTPSTARRTATTTRITTWRLQAQQQPTPKGFGSKPNPNSNQLSKLKQEEEVPKEGGDEDEIPQEVIERMGVRIVASVLMPMGLGLVSLSGYGTLRDQNVDVPFWVPVATSFLTFGASALGIAYGALSSSWDPDRKGSFLGLEQLERNWVELWKE